MRIEGTLGGQLGAKISIAGLLSEFARADVKEIGKAFRIAQ